MKTFSKHENKRITAHEVIKDLGKVVYLRPLKATRTSQEHLNFDFESDSTAEVVKVSLRNNGKWYEVGKNRSSSEFYPNGTDAPTHFDGF